MKRLRILITAGPTQEPIDPVRFICNHSTGAMGFAIARFASQAGHRVTLISGPTQLKAPKGIRFVAVQTARQMYQQALRNFPGADAVIMAAAVSDYRPGRPARHKIKKTKKPLNLRLVRNPDILGALAKIKKNKILAGFALETENLYKNALKKLKEKRLDIIVGNQVSKRQNIFGNNKTSVLILEEKGNRQYLKHVDKNKVAKEILLRVEKLSNSISA